MLPDAGLQHCWFARRAHDEQNAADSVKYGKKRKAQPNNILGSPYAAREFYLVVSIYKKQYTRVQHRQQQTHIRGDEQMCCCTDAGFADPGLKQICKPQLQRGQCYRRRPHDGEPPDEVIRPVQRRSEADPCDEDGWHIHQDVKLPAIQRRGCLSRASIAHLQSASCVCTAHCSYIIHVQHSAASRKKQTHMSKR